MTAATPCIILAEDEPLIALDIQLTLQDAGIAVDGPYSTVDTLLGALRDRPRDEVLCTILDVQLEDGEVYPAADLAHQVGIPIIFHSGHADSDTLASRYPGAALCVKPSTPRELVDQISALRSCRG